MILSFLQRFFLPFTCVLCGDLSTLNKDLCVVCLGNLPRIISGCEICGRNIPHHSCHPATRSRDPGFINPETFTSLCPGSQRPSRDDSIIQSSICGQCLINPPYFDRTIALFPYTHPIDKFIIGLKFQRKLIYAKLLGELFAEHLATYYQNLSIPELITPVPLHKNRLKERSFNQALELSKAIAKKLNLKIDIKSCQKIRHSEAQSLINAKHRQKNVKNSFSVIKNIKTKHIAILDDVMTTGHTVNELSKVLKNSGVEKIDVWCMARTI